VPGGQPGHGEDQPPKPDGTDARSRSDDEGHDYEPEARTTEPRRPDSQGLP
jgi:hypothetical protein